MSLKRNLKAEHLSPNRMLADRLFQIAALQKEHLAYNIHSYVSSPIQNDTVPS